MVRSAILMTASLAFAACAAAQQTPVSASTSSQAKDDSAGKTHVPRQQRDAAQRAWLDGAKHLEKDDPGAALVAFQRAASLEPGNRRYTDAVDIARQHMVQSLVQQADKDRIIGHYDAARAAITQAYRVDPGNPMVAQHLNEVDADQGAGEPALRLEEPEAAAPIQLQPQTGRHSFHLNMGEREVIRQVLTAYGIQPSVDDSVGTQTIRYDVDNVDFSEAERTLGLATGNFFVPIDPQHALVAKDTRTNHVKFDRMGLETVYLPGLRTQDLTEIVTMAKNVFAMQTATAAPGQSAITVRGPVEAMPALNATLQNLLGGRPELQLDVRMYEVDRTKATNLGAILPNQWTVFNVFSEARQVLQQNSSLVQQIIASGLAAPGDWEAILAILVGSGQLSNTIFNSPFAVFGGGLTMTGVEFQGGTLNMKLNSSDVRSVDQMQLRVLDGEQGTIKVGERYPIETSSYSSLSGTGGLNIPGLTSAGTSSTLANLGISQAQLEAAATQAIPQVQYQDIGLTLDVTPRFQGRNRVSLKFDLKLNSLQGTSLNGLPVLNNREYQAITSLAVGETSIMTASLSRQESDALTGIPGLADLPGFEGMTNRDANLNYAELAIVVTPHIVRSTQQQFAHKMVMLPHIGQ